MPILDLTNEVLVSKYEDFIKTSPYGHMMQSTNWSKVKANWDRDYVYLTDHEGNITAALSILSVKNDNLNAFMYAPRGPVCDFYDIDLVTELLKEADPVVKQRNGFLLRIDPEVIYDPVLVERYREKGYTLRSREQEDQKTFSNPRNNMILDIKDKTEEDVMASFSSKQRTKIRKTYKIDLKTRKVGAGDPLYKETLDRFYALTEEMAQRKGITYRPYTYFDNLLHAFENAYMFETYDDEEVLSTSIVVIYNRKAFYIYAASSNNKRQCNASIQTNYEAIKYALTQGAHEYDFGGIFAFDANDGLYTFKANFCGKEGHKEFIGELDLIFNEKLYLDFI